MDRIKFQQYLSKYMARVSANRKQTWDYYDTDIPAWGHALMEMEGDNAEAIANIERLLDVYKE